MKRSNAAMVLIIIVIILGSGISFLAFRGSVKEAPLSPAAACTEEAKLCPDGSGVARQAPNCEFPECPSETPALKS